MVLDDLDIVCDRCGIGAAMPLLDAGRRTSFGTVAVREWAYETGWRITASGEDRCPACSSEAASGAASL